MQSAVPKQTANDGVWVNFYTSVLWIFALFLNHFRCCLNDRMCFLFRCDLQPTASLVSVNLCLTLICQVEQSTNNCFHRPLEFVNALLSVNSHETDPVSGLKAEKCHLFLHDSTLTSAIYVGIQVKVILSIMLLNKNAFFFNFSNMCITVWYTCNFFSWNNESWVTVY